MVKVTRRPDARPGTMAPAVDLLTDLGERPFEARARARQVVRASVNTLVLCVRVCLCMHIHASDPRTTRSGRPLTGPRTVHRARRRGDHRTCRRHILGPRRPSRPVSLAPSSLPPLSFPLVFPRDILLAPHARRRDCTSVLPKRERSDLSTRVVEKSTPSVDREIIFLIPSEFSRY